MPKLIKNFLIYLSILTISLTFSSATNSSSNIKLSEQSVNYGIDKNVFNLAIKAYEQVISKGYNKRYLGIIDYSLPSTTPRFWIIDMHTMTLSSHIHVAHGIKSGQHYAYKFSNAMDSKMSSLGVFVTGEIYYGIWGRSLNLHGLEPGFNSNAYQRRIVIHDAPYVQPDKQMRLGRSWGCLALSRKVGQKIISTLSKGAVIFAYYPDTEWLKNSRFLFD
jgi:hypothetical protein